MGNFTLRLDQFFRAHFTPLLRWAEQDQHTAPEKAYKQWVKEKFAICNPLIVVPIENFQMFA